MRNWIVFIILSLLHSCGKNNFPDYSEKPQREVSPGNYEAKLLSMNSKVTGPIQGSAKLRIKGVQLYIKIKLNTNLPLEMKAQYVHVGDKCPAKKLRGVMNFEEVLSIVGGALIPLDKNLKTQMLGIEKFPVTDEEGNYIYERAGSTYHLLKDLLEKDQDKNDILVKLGMDEDVNLADRTIVIYGFVNDLSFPIACGEINEILD